MAGYIETSRSRIKNDGQFNADWLVFGVAADSQETASADADGPVPVVGKSHDFTGAVGAAESDVTVAVCQNVQIVPGADHGRVLFKSYWRELKEYA